MEGSTIPADAMQFGPIEISKGGGSLAIYIPKMVRQHLGLKHKDICYVTLKIHKRAPEKVDKNDDAV